MDEWKSLKNSRFMNINLHQFGFENFNLGIIKINGSCPAEKVLEIMNLKLRDFDITVVDVVGTTTDAASVMVRFGSLSSFIHQQCYAHASYLAVMDVINLKEFTTLEENVSSRTFFTRNIDQI